MERKSEKDAEANTDRSLFARFVEGVVVFVICGFLVRLAVESILAVKKPLLIIAAIVVTIIIIWRYRKWRRHRDEY